MSPTSPIRGHRGVSRARRMALTSELLSRLDDGDELTFGNTRMRFEAS